MKFKLNDNRDKCDCIKNNLTKFYNSNEMPCANGSFEL